MKCCYCKNEIDQTHKGYITNVISWHYDCINFKFYSKNEKGNGEHIVFEEGRNDRFYISQEEKINNYKVS